MVNYVIRRLLLLPLTLFCILIVNFVIINLAPGDPVSVTEVSDDGNANRSEKQSGATDDQYLQFREHYGLTLPTLFNRWPAISYETVLSTLQTLSKGSEETDVKTYNALKIQFGDQAKYTMRHLIAIAEDRSIPDPLRRLAVRFIIRGGTLQGHLGAKLTPKERAENRVIAKNNILLQKNRIKRNDSEEVVNEKIRQIKEWYLSVRAQQHFEPSFSSQVSIFFFETRFWRYMSKICTLDFGTLRNDPNRSVITEVVKRFRYSLTLAIFPMLITFVLCQLFGFYMATKRGRWQDLTLNVIFLILYATPVFVVAPFLIEKIALNNTFPFTDIPIPISGFNSPEREYMQLTSWGRLWDILQHIALPLVAILYGSLAVQSRLSRTAVLEVLKLDFIRTAKAKGLSPAVILVKHAGRNAAITIVTSIAGSLGVILGGSLIIETIFGIDGFGMFFYDAVINRDYNVIMFSVISGAFFSLLGYLMADIAYTLLDPRVSLD